jgi:hypothetical protein
MLSFWLRHHPHQESNPGHFSEFWSCFNIFLVSGHKHSKFAVNWSIPSLAVSEHTYISTNNLNCFIFDRLRELIVHFCVCTQTHISVLIHSLTILVRWLILLFGFLHSLPSWRITLCQLASFFNKFVATLHIEGFFTCKSKQILHEQA